MFKWRKDGGPDSNVWGFYIPEIKRLFSVVLLRFQGASREAFHDHAFHSIAWVLKGRLIEEQLDGSVHYYPASILPYAFPRSRFHRVSTEGPNVWVLNLRGPWLDTWHESIDGEVVTLTHGRKIIGRNP